MYLLHDMLITYKIIISIQHSGAGGRDGAHAAHWWRTCDAFPGSD